MINEEILKQSGIESKNNTNSYLMYAVGVRFGCLVVFSLFLQAFFINISYKFNLTTMKAIGHQKINVDNVRLNKGRNVIYVKNITKMRHS